MDFQNAFKFGWTCSLVQEKREKGSKGDILFETPGRCSWGADETSNDGEDVPRRRDYMVSFVCHSRDPWHTDLLRPRVVGNSSSCLTDFATISQAKQCSKLFQSQHYLTAPVSYHQPSIGRLLLEGNPHFRGIWLENAPVVSEPYMSSKRKTRYCYVFLSPVVGRACGHLSQNMSGHLGH